VNSKENKPQKFKIRNQNNVGTLSNKIALNIKTTEPGAFEVIK
jgi:hypothetical protein